MHPGQLVLDTLACENAEMTAQSLEGWYQEYVAKRAAMGVVVNYKEATSAATCMNLTSQFHWLNVISLILRTWVWYVIECNIFEPEFDMSLGVISLILRNWVWYCLHSLIVIYWVWYFEFCYHVIMLYSVSFLVLLYWVWVVNLFWYICSLVVGVDQCACCEVIESTMQNDIIKLPVTTLSSLASRIYDVNSKHV